MTRTPLAVAVAVTVVSLAGAANAQVVTATVAPAPGAEGGESADRAGASVAGLIGFVVGSDSTSGFAIGGRGGYTFPFHLYLGGDATFYIGAGGGAVVSVAPEVGYDIGLGEKMLVRPYVGLGFVDYTGGGGGAFELYPGGEFLYDITPNFFIGGDLRILFAFLPGASATIGGITVGGGGGTAVAFNPMGTAGYKF